MKTKQCIWILLMAALFGILSTGCSLLPSKKMDEAKRFMLTVPEEKLTPFPSASLSTLRVRRLVVNEPFQDRSFVYRLSANQYETDVYNVFISTPDGLLTACIQQALAQMNVAKQVLTSSSLLAGGVVLEGNVEELYGDFSDKQKPEAVMSIRFSLTETGRNGVPYFIQTFTSRQPVATNTPDALVDGWNQCLMDLIHQVGKQISKVQEKGKSDTSP